MNSMIEFSLSQVIELYGTKWFPVEFLRKSSKVDGYSQANDSMLGAIEWKTKLSSRFCLIVEREDYLNKGLMAELKSCVDQASVAPQLISFGILPENKIPDLKFTDLNDEWAIVFSSRILAEYIDEEVSKKINLQGDLQAILSSQSKRKEVIDFLATQSRVRKD